MPVSLWLDDLDESTGRPVPEGWIHVRTVDEAKTVLLSQQVQAMSLDHDLGICKDCLGGLTEDEWMAQHEYEAMPYCSHFGTGYDLLLWMAEKGVWSVEKPTVHSLNPVGRDRMLGVINRYFPEQENT